ncbi:Terminal nucleotidyltransferase 4A [Nowakowskiella sp. JEL0078]|nr:Terminal nucleotidyltransferase 4A [Nowakowskiella sp. JEL0078]
MSDDKATSENSPNNTFPKFSFDLPDEEFSFRKLVQSLGPKPDSKVPSKNLPKKNKSKEDKYANQVFDCDRFSAGNNTPWLKKSSKQANLNPFKRFHHEVLEFEFFLRPTNEEKMERERLFKRCCEILIKRSPKHDLLWFGSIPSETALPTSDLDLTIISKNANASTNPNANSGSENPNLLKSLRKSLYKGGSEFTNIKYVPKARVPILKFQEAKTGYNVDISQGQSTSELALKAVKMFMEEERWLKPMTMFFKQFLAARKLNDPSNGGLGSYTLILLLTSFLRLRTDLDRSNVTGGVNYRDQLEPDSELFQLITDFLDFFGYRFDFLKYGIDAGKPRDYQPEIEQFSSYVNNTKSMTINEVHEGSSLEPTEDGDESADEKVEDLEFNNQMHSDHEDESLEYDNLFMTVDDDKNCVEPALNGESQVDISASEFQSVISSNGARIFVRSQIEGEKKSQRKFPFVLDPMSLTTHNLSYASSNFSLVTAHFRGALKEIRAMISKGTNSNTSIIGRMLNVKDVLKFRSNLGQVKPNQRIEKVKLKPRNGLPLPNCPFVDSSIPSKPEELFHFGIHQPATTLSFFFTALFSVATALYILFFLNGLKILNKKILDPNVFNGYWGLYFFFLGVSFLVDSFRYQNQTIISTDEEAAFDKNLLWAASLSRCTAVLWLSYALNYQKNFKSTVRPLDPNGGTVTFSQISQQFVNETTSLNRRLSASSYGTNAINDSSSISSGQRSFVRRSNTFSSVSGRPQSFNSRQQSYRDIENTDDSNEDLSDDIDQPLTFSEQIFESISAILLSWEFIFFFLWFLHVATICFLANNSSVFVASPLKAFSAAVYLVVSFLQHTPIVIIFISIILSPSHIIVASSDRRNMIRQRHGPTRITKIFLVVSISFGIFFWVEPSRLSRVVLESIGRGDENCIQDLICIVPPNFWDDVSNCESKKSGKHGWASLLDVFQWMGFTSLISLLFFIKTEHYRIKEVSM